MMLLISDKKSKAYRVNSWSCSDVYSSEVQQIHHEAPQHLLKPISLRYLIHLQFLILVHCAEGTFILYICDHLTIQIKIPLAGR